MSSNDNAIPIPSWAWPTMMKIRAERRCPHDMSDDDLFSAIVIAVKEIHGLMSSIISVLTGKVKEFDEDIVKHMVLNSKFTDGIRITDLPKDGEHEAK